MHNLDVLLWGKKERVCVYVCMCVYVSSILAQVRDSREGSRIIIKPPIIINNGGWQFKCDRACQVIRLRDPAPCTTFNHLA